jgi:hypothetical protein
MTVRSVQVMQLPACGIGARTLLGERVADLTACELDCVVNLGLYAQHAFGRLPRFGARVIAVETYGGRVLAFRAWPTDDVRPEMAEHSEA